MIVKQQKSFIVRVLWALVLVAALSAVDVSTASANVTTDFSVTLTDEQTWVRPLPGNNVGGHPSFGTFTEIVPGVSSFGYAAVTFAAAVTGPYTLEVAPGELNDPIAFVYQDSFDPDNPLVNFVVGDDDSAGNRLPKIDEQFLTLEAGRSYYLVISTYGTSDFGTTSFSVTGPGGAYTPPSPPTASAATNITGGSFQANWDSSDGATGYRLDVAEDSDFSSLVSSYNDLNVENVTTYNVTGLSPGATFYYRVRAYDANGPSASSNIIEATTAAKADQTITFPDLPVKTYGDTDFDPGATATSGLPISYTSSNPGVATIVAGQIRIVGAGASTITASQSGDSQYNAASIVEQTLTVNARALTVEADAQSKVYGEADPSLTYTITAGELVNGDTLSGALTREAGEAVGSYAIQQGMLTAGANYALTFIPAELNIVPRALTVEADAQSKVYGEADPSLTYTITAGELVNGDTLSGVLTREAGEAVVSYAIQQGTLTAGANYALTFIPADLMITEYLLTIGGSFTAHSKFFDGAAQAMFASNNLVLNGVVGDDGLALANIEIAFVQAEAGVGIPVTIVAAEVVGANRQNYTFSLAGAPTAEASIYALPTVTAPLAEAVLNLSAPVFQGTAQAGSAILVQNGDDLLCETTVQDNGEWQCTAAQPLNDGSYLLSVISIVQPDNLSYTIGLPVTIETTTPWLRNNAFSTEGVTPISDNVFRASDSENRSDGDGLTVVDYSAPGTGTVEINAQGAFTYTPAPDFVGVDTFIYTAMNAMGRTAQAVVVIVVMSADAVGHAPHTIVGSQDEPTVFQQDNGRYSVQVQVPAGLYDGDLADTDVFHLVYTPLTQSNGDKSPNMEAFRALDIFFSLEAFLNSERLSNVIFAEPLILTFTFDEETIQGFVEGKVGLYYWQVESESWRADGIEIVAVDRAQNTVTIALHHLTEFGLFAQDGPTNLPPAEQPGQSVFIYMPALER